MIIVYMCIIFLSVPRSVAYLKVQWRDKRLSKVVAVDIGVDYAGDASPPDFVKINFYPPLIKK